MNFKDQIKNLFGWSTKRKLIVIAVDDYGNVRLNSKKSLSNIQQKYKDFSNRFDLLDTLETRQDLEHLFEVLTSVKDSKGQSAVFTPYSLSMNLDFEKMAEIDFDEILVEPVTSTFEKLSEIQPNEYKGAFSLFQEGIKNGLIHPQFHGKEHFNYKALREKLKSKDKRVRVSLENRSLVNFGKSQHKTISWTAAYSFYDPISDTNHFRENISEGIEQFKKVYGYQPSIFTPPAQQLPKFIEKELSDFKIEALDKPFYRKRHKGYGNHQFEFNFTGLNKSTNLYKIVRNVVFEPSLKGSNHIKKAIDQIEAAFLWNKPAIISSHRVNYCGHIKEQNRKLGLDRLKLLLDKILLKWPEAEFISANDLLEIIKHKNCSDA